MSNVEKELPWIEDATTKYEYMKRAAKGEVTKTKNKEQRGMSWFIRNSYILLFVVCISTYPVHKFFEKHVIRLEKNSSEFHSPIPVANAKETKQIAIPTPTPVDKEEVYEQMYGTVWHRESGEGTNLSGLNGYCISLGMINEIGYAPKDNYCFKDRTEQHETFLLWARNRSGKNCVKTGYCRESFEGLLRLYSNNEYEAFYYQKYAFAIPEVK